MSQTLSQIDLTEAEIAKLPAGIRRKIEAAFGPANKANGKWMLVGTATAKTAEVVGSALTQFTAVTTTHIAARREKNIERLLEMIVEDIPRADVDIELELENAEMRAQYLTETKLLTAQDVREQSGLKPRNKSEPASRWKREGKVFAVRKGAIDLYPAFQFIDGSPHPAMKKILTEIGDAFTPWQIAFWFESGNGWLDGAEPQDCLDQTEDVIEAAQRLAEPAIG